MDGKPCFLQTHFAETIGHPYAAGKRLWRKSDRGVGGTTKYPRKLLEMMNTLIILIVLMILCIYVCQNLPNCVYYMFAFFFSYTMIKSLQKIKSHFPWGEKKA